MKLRSTLIAALLVISMALFYVSGHPLVTIIGLSIGTILYAIESDIQRAKPDTIPIIDLSRP